MEKPSENPLTTRKNWRREVKKLRRKRIRQKLAKERCIILEKEEAERLKNPNYQLWLHEQENLELFQCEMEERERQKNEDLWLRREQKAQDVFQKEKERRDMTEKAKEADRQRILKEFENEENLVKQRLEEKKQLFEEKQKQYEIFMKKIQEYIEGNIDLPIELTEWVDSNPGKPICDFFKKTGCCRFGDRCSRNHSRPGISKILLLPHFFNHIRLEQSKYTEYGNDLQLEYTDEEIHHDYETFFEDIVTELKKFGKIENFRTCLNCAPHLRGNVYVEFYKERSAAKAFQKLQGRYYAGKRINLEFCSIPCWSAAICGLSIARICPKGKNCNFLHIFKNPGNQYNKRQRTIGIECATRTKTHSINNEKSWDDIENGSERDRNWRWSESPERLLSSKENRNRFKYEDKRSFRSRNKDEGLSRTSLSRQISRDSSKRKSRSRSRGRYHNSEITQQRSKPNRSTSSRKTSTSRYSSRYRKSPSIRRRSEANRSRSSSRKISRSRSSSTYSRKSEQNRTQEKSDAKKSKHAEKKRKRKHKSTKSKRSRNK